MRSKDSILDGNKDNINIHYPGSQDLGRAGCKCPLHCPHPSFLKATSFLMQQIIFIAYKSSTTLYPPCPLPGAGVRSTFTGITTILLGIS
jgi:hypothetical protein